MAGSGLEPEAGDWKAPTNQWLWALTQLSKVIIESLYVVLGKVLVQGTQS